jgi:RND family efflux transporter MFP subunit
MNHGHTGHPDPTSQQVHSAPLAQAPAKGRNAVGWVIAGVATVAFVGFFGMRAKTFLDKRKAVDAERAKTAGETKKAAPTRTIVPQAIRWRPSVEITGTLRPWREADIAFETQGRLVALNVAMGDTVKAGQLLGTLDASRAGAQVNQAQAQSKASRAQLALAEDNLRRTESLVASKSIPEAQAEQARQNVALARAQVEASEATTRLAQVGQGVSAITAPFAGVVTKAPSSPGGVVNPGMPLMRIEDVSRFRLMGSVNEEDVGMVTVGAPVVVRYMNREVQGRVTALVPSLDQATRRAPVEIEVVNNPNNPLLGFGFVRARINGKDEVDAFRLPPSARRSGSQDEIIVVRNGSAHILRVNHATADDGAWIVRAGLNVGDMVLNAPSGDVREGDALGELVQDAIAEAPTTAPSAPPATKP